MSDLNGLAAGAQSPEERWMAQSTSAVRQLAERVVAAHANATAGEVTAEHALRVIASGTRSGMRPARALMASGLLTADNQHLFTPEPPTETEAVPDTSAEPEDRHESAIPITFDDVDLEIALQVSVPVLKRLQLLPYQRDDTGRVLVASSVQAQDLSPDKHKEICKHLGFGASPEQVRIVWVDANQLGACIERVDVAETTQHMGEAVSDGSEPRQAAENWKKLVATGNTENASHSGQLMRSVLLQAAERGASDLHLFAARTQSGDPCYMARLRIDGDMVDVKEGSGPLIIPRPVGAAMTTRVVTTCRLGDDALGPRDGGCTIELPSTRQRFDLRAACVPQNDGFYTVIRLLGSREAMNMADIYPPHESPIAAQVTEILADMRRGGLFLMAGATGSGKSTFLAAAMEHLNRSTLNLISLEAPVEYRIDGVRQIQVDPHSEKMNFYKGTTASMRLNPNVIMVGELRDPQTVDAAVQAAETGHTVLSTVHVTDAASTGRRFKHLGVNPTDIAFVLKGVLAQHLVKTLCAYCRQQGNPPDQCRYCQGTGWRGRTAVGEVLRVTEDIAEMIAVDEPPPKIARAAEVSTMAMHAGALIKAGRTTFDEIADQLGVSAAQVAQRASQQVPGSGDLA